MISVASYKWLVTASIDGCTWRFVGAAKSKGQAKRIACQQPDWLRVRVHDKESNVVVWEMEVRG